MCTIIILHSLIFLSFGIIFSNSFFFRGGSLHPQHMEVPRLGVKSELQLPSYTTATATQHLNHVYDLYLSSQQCWILNPMSKASDRTHNLMDTSRVCYCWPRREIPTNSLFGAFSFSSVIFKFLCVWLDTLTLVA